MVRHELGRNRPTNKALECLLAKRYVLLGLNHAMLVGTAFGLNRNHELPTMPVNSYINFVNFDLSDFFYRCAQVVLERVRSDSKEHIHQPVIPNLGQQCLFITQRIRADDFWRRIWNLNSEQLISRHDPIQPDQAKSIFSTARPFDDPLQPIFSSFKDAGRKFISVTE